jgi:multidrug resistance protein, MATE family
LPVTHSLPPNFPIPLIKHLCSHYLAAMSEKLQLDISYRQIIKIAIPISFAILIPQLNFFINSIFLGGLGTEALGLAGLTGVYYLIYTSTGYGLNNGLQALIARRAGENRPDEIGKLFSQGVIIALSMALLGIVLTYTVVPVIFKWILHKPSDYREVMNFLYIRIWGLPFLYVYQMRNALLVGTNQSKYLPYGTAVDTAVNIILDYCFIYGHWGFAKMGFNGAAWASIIAEFTGMFVTFLIIHYKGITKRFGLFAHWGFDRPRIRLILQQSLPLMFQHAISIISWLFFFILVERTGNATWLAVSQTMRNIFGVFGVFTWAIAGTTNAMVSNIIGQGRKEEVLKLVYMIMKLSLSVSLILSVLLNIMPGPIFRLFGQSDAFVAEATPVLRVVTLAMVIMSVAVTWLNAVVGTGSSKYAFLIEVVAIVLYCVYVFAVMEWFKLPVAIGWMSEFLYWAVLLVLSGWFMHTGRWKRRQL